MLVRKSLVNLLRNIPATIAYRLSLRRSSHAGRPFRAGKQFAWLRRSCAERVLQDWPSAPGRFERDLSERACRNGRPYRPIVAETRPTGVRSASKIAGIPATLETLSHEQNKWRANVDESIGHCPPPSILFFPDGGLLAGNRKPDSLGIARSSRRRHQNDRGNA